jgi:hypothetical protein
MCGCRVWIRLEKNIYEEGIEVLLKSRLGRTPLSLFVASSTWKQKASKYG